MHTLRISRRFSFIIAFCFFYVAGAFANTGEEPRTVPSWQIESLLALLEDCSPEIHQVAMKWLVGQKVLDARLVEPVMQFLKNNPVYSEGAVMLAESAEAHDVTILRDPNPAVRLAAVSGQPRPVTDRFIPALVDLLKDPEPRIRLHAALRLGETKNAADRALPALVNLLKDSDDDVRVTTVQTLERMVPEMKMMAPGGTGAIPGIRALLKDPNRRVREAAFSALVKMEAATGAEIEMLLQDKELAISRLIPALVQQSLVVGRAMPELIALLKDHDPKIRLVTVECFAMGGQKNLPGNMIPALMASLKDPDPQICATVLSMVPDFGAAAEGAIPDLITLLKEREKKPESPKKVLLSEKEAIKDWPLEFPEPSHPVLLAARAAIVLGKIGKPAQKAIPDLTRLLTNNEFDIRSAAAVALKKLGAPTDEELANPLSNILHQLANLSVEDLDEALFEIDLEADTETVPALLEMLETVGSDSHFFVISALGSIKTMTPAILPDLVEALKNPNKQIQVSAASLLEKMEPPALKAVPDLIALLKDPDVQVRAFAISALKKIGPMEAVSDLVALFKDPNREVRTAARSAVAVADPTGGKSLAASAALLVDGNADVRLETVLALKQLQVSGIDINPVLMRVLASPANSSHITSDLLRHTSRPAPQVAWFALELANASPVARHDLLVDAYLTSEMTPLRREALRWLGGKTLLKEPDVTGLSPEARAFAVKALQAAFEETGSRPKELARCRREIALRLQRLAAGR
ncbi:MAG: HEAT repeat domain-containing protein [Verrucomicrobiota bacterium]